MKKKMIEEKKREILQKLSYPLLSEQERNRLKDDYRKLINKSLRFSYCKKSKR